MKNRQAEKLSNIEREIIAEIRALRNSARNSLPGNLLKGPAQVVHHFIRASHGNVRLRIRPIARELGVEMRTLERLFAHRYRTTMAEFHLNVRLDFSRWILSITQPTKIAAIAAMLGYERVQDFNRFFRKHTGRSPLEWRSEHQKNTPNAEGN